MLPDLLAGLTPAQRSAVQHVEGPLLIIAGPGSGKTRVVTHRVAYLLSQRIPARSILALTFTNKAADEMKLRLERLAPGQAVWMGTFHRFCARLLRQHASLAGLSENFTIFDAADSLQALKRVLEDAGYKATHFSPESLAHEISWAKNHLVPPEQFVPRNPQISAHVGREVYRAYREKLLAINSVDFDDLLLHVVQMLRDNPELRAGLDARYKYILVDEYQDTNLAQYALVRALSIDYPNLAVTGDPDQSIYGWRGANLGNILDFEQDYPQVTVVRLEQNYRSTQHIVRAAGALIAHNRRRKEKTHFTENPPGAPVRLVKYASQRQEADDVVVQIAMAITRAAQQRRARDFAIFYRVNALSRNFENALREHGLPYQVVGGVSFYQRQEVKDALAYLHLLNNPRNDGAFERIVNTPPRGIGPSTVAKLRKHAIDQRLSLWEAARESGLIGGLAKRSAVSVAQFVALLDRLSLSLDAPLDELLSRVLDETGYIEHLRSDSSPESEDRLANLEEMLTDAKEFVRTHPEDPSLEAFLERSALIADIDNLDTENDRVTLMTMHAAKGLEFPCVFISACEEGLLPHIRSRDDPDQVEEERRLLFVAMTRAEEELQLSFAAQREFRGATRITAPSSFLLELPRGEIEYRDVANAWLGTRSPRISTAAAARSPVLAVDESIQIDPDDAAVFTDAEASDELADAERAAPAAARRDATRDAAPARTRLVTAAELLSRESAVAPDDASSPFREGAVVAHPEYGQGVIVAVAGRDAKRKATVCFMSGERRNFVLAHAPLRVVAD